MKRALFDLYESPHNRFKVFKNGQLIYTEKIGEKDELEETLSQFFERQEGINTLASVLCSTLLGKCFFGGHIGVPFLIIELKWYAFLAHFWLI